MIRADGDAVLLSIKAVPGAQRDQIAGPLGTGDGARLKVRISAPPEDGKANKAICKLLGAALGVSPRSVRVVSGKSSPKKDIRIEGVGVDVARSRLLP